MPHPALTRTDHRPWPISPGPWIGRQTWHDLLFIHWPVPAAQLRRFVPSELDIDEFAGTSWVGVVPFRMSGVTFRGLPSVPGVSAFPELNVRLYVRREGKPGVWFLSLDATKRLAVWAARKFFHLPYQRAHMLIRHVGEAIEYSSQRPTANFASCYEPTSPAYEATAGTLEHWLTERYCLYAAGPDASLWCCDIHHLPWPLQRAKAHIETNTMLEHHGIVVPPVDPLLHFARRLDMVLWRPTRVV